MPALDEPQKSTVTLIGDLTKQIITLSSAFLTVTVTFSKDLLDLVPVPNILRIAWLSYVTSVMAGLLVVMSLTGRVRDAPVDGRVQFSGFLTSASVVQVVAFLIGTICIAIIGWSVVGASPST